MRLKKMCYERSFFQHCLKKAVFFHHENAPPYRAARVHQFFVDNNFEVVTHASYSPDVAPCNFWLFPILKDTLRVGIFSSRSALATTIFQWSQWTPKKRLLWPCNRGISIVKNVYVYRVITLRNYCISSFLGWVIFFNKLRELRTWICHVYPSSVVCDYAVELPHWSFCSRSVVCWRFGEAGFE